MDIKWIYTLGAAILVVIGLIVSSISLPAAYTAYQQIYTTDSEVAALRAEVGAVHETLTILIDAVRENTKVSMENNGYLRALEPAE